MNERARFEAEEIRGLAERYGGSRVNLAGGGGYYQFSPKCWCCPGHDNDTMQRPENEGDPWVCVRGCSPSTAIRPCPERLAGHHGYRKGAW